MKDLYKVLSGKILINVSGSTLKIEPFSIDLKYLAELRAEEVYNEAFLDGNYSADEILHLIRENGWWTDEDEERLKSIPKNIEQMKLDYYNNFHSKSTTEYIQKNIVSQQNTLNTIYSRKHSLYEYSCEYAAEQSKLNYLLENSVRNMDGSPLDFGCISISTIIYKYGKELLYDNDLRQLAKNPELKTRWSNFRSVEIFANKDLTDMQLSLMTWCRVYDSVYESTECPPDDVIEDDIALDGWFVFRRRKSIEEKKKQSADSKFNNNGASENFIMAHTPEEVRAIYDMNSAEGKREVKLLEHDLSSKSSFEEIKRSSVQQNIAIAANRASFKRG